MRLNKKILAMVLIVLPLAILFLGGSTNYENQGWNLVDSGKHCDWKGTTTFSADWNFGVNQWNAGDTMTASLTYHRSFQQ